MFHVKLNFPNALILRAVCEMLLLVLLCGLSLPEEHEQHVYVAWAYSRYAAGLCQCVGLYALKFLSALCREVVNFFVVELAFDFDVLQAPHLFGENAFARDVAFVLEVYLGSFGYLFVAVGRVVECRAELWQQRF